MKATAFLLASVLAIGALGVSAGAASAATARASGVVTVYSGPGYDYAPIGRLAANQVVSLAECTPSGRWCRLAGRSHAWVLGSYLIGSAAKLEATPYKPLVNPFFHPLRPFHPEY